jgi:hypothetical protein
VYKRFDEFRHHAPVVLAATGGFTNRLNQPEGLTAESGNIVNAVLMQDRHGLVIVDEGGIQVLNLKRPTFRLPKGGPVIDNPLEDLLAYSQLIGWSRSHRVTLFQTQLLAFSDSITIDEKRAKPQLRERRVLALARDRKTQELSHLIVNVTRQYHLSDVANEVFALLATRNKKVEALLNLDVGSYDILNVYDPQGNLSPVARGMVNIERATNLIIYSR